MTRGQRVGNASITDLRNLTCMKGWWPITYYRLPLAIHCRVLLLLRPCEKLACSLWRLCFGGVNAMTRYGQISRINEMRSMGQRVVPKLGPKWPQKREDKKWGIDCSFFYLYNHPYIRAICLVLDYSGPLPFSLPLRWVAILEAKLAGHSGRRLSLQYKCNVSLSSAHLFCPSCPECHAYVLFLFRPFFPPWWYCIEVSSRLMYTVSPMP